MSTDFQSNVQSLLVLEFPLKKFWMTVKIVLFSAKSEGRRTTVSGLEWGMIRQVSNIIFPVENAGYSKASDKGLLDAREVGNYLNSLLDHA